MPLRLRRWRVGAQEGAGGRVGARPPRARPPRGTRGGRGVARLATQRAWSKTCRGSAVAAAAA
eukprot:14176372-Alexandrium_andersonii.AAC.1